MRGQSVVEYLLGLSVLIVGTAVLLPTLQLERAWHTLVVELVRRVARDHLP